MTIILLNVDLCVSGADHHIMCSYQPVGVGGSRLPVRAQGVHHRLPPGEERAEADDEQRHVPPSTVQLHGSIVKSR